jgi:hypothetical protein
MSLAVETYTEQTKRWPKNGHHILAQSDEASIVVYQAYRPAIGRYVAEHGHFGGPDFAYGRMSWIKPNFLWMMYRCGWATKENQEVILAVRICREGFNEILCRAVPSTFAADAYGSRAAWQEDLHASNVRLQWDPDHDPHGGKLPRRAIQLGLRGNMLKSYGGPWIVSVEDISDFVRTQSAVLKRHGPGAIMTPKEEIYPVTDPHVRQRLGMPLSSGGFPVENTQTFGQGEENRHVD